jgi:hypothetical protein
MNDVCRWSWPNNCSRLSTGSLGLVREKGAKRATGVVIISREYMPSDHVHIVLLSLIEWKCFAQSLSRERMFVSAIPAHASPRSNFAVLVWEFGKRVKSRHVNLESRWCRHMGDWSFAKYQYCWCDVSCVWFPREKNNISRVAQLYTQLSRSSLQKYYCLIW